MLLPLAVDVAYGSDNWRTFATSAILTFVIGISLSLSCKNAVGDGLTLQQSFILTTVLFATLPVFAALPYFLGMNDVRYVDAFFEAMSGLTTTGATVLTMLDELPPGILFWRGMTQWIGGIGIIIVALVFLPLLRVGGMQLFRHSSVDSFETILPRMAEVTRSISMIYILLTVLCGLMYSISGMNFLDSVVHAMTTIATGGFANYDDSFGSLGAPAEYFGALFMVLASLPFFRYVQLIKGTSAPLFKDSQIRYFLLFCVVVVAAMMLWQVLLLDIRSERAFRKALFNCVSIITGTGYVSDDYASWGSFPIALFFLLGLVGGCAGSTSCSIKIFRFQLLFSSILVQVKKLRLPHGVFVTRYEGHKVPEDVLSSVMAFFVLFVFTLAIVSILLAFTGLGAVASISGAAAALANIGPALADPIGPTGNYSSLSDPAKWLLSVTMLIGRLELMAMFAIFTYKFWRP